METAAQTKNVKIVTGDGGFETKVTVTPEDTASSILQQAGLAAGDYKLHKPSDNSVFDPGASVWKDAVDGGKFHVTARAVVGRMIR